MGTIKINNIVYGSNNASEIIYKSQTVEEKLDTIPIFDINDNGNVPIVGDVLTYGHIIDNLNSDSNGLVLSAKQGKILSEKIDNIDLSDLENGIATNAENISNLDSDINLMSASIKILEDNMTNNAIINNMQTSINAFNNALSASEPVYTTISTEKKSVTNSTTYTISVPSEAARVNIKKTSVSNYVTATITVGNISIGVPIGVVNEIWTVNCSGISSIIVTVVDQYNDNNPMELEFEFQKMSSKGVMFNFGIDANGNYGYYKDGADTVTPFNNIKTGEMWLRCCKNVTTHHNYTGGMTGCFYFNNLDFSDIDSFVFSYQIGTSTKNANPFTISNSNGYLVNVDPAGTISNQTVNVNNTTLPCTVQINVSYQGTNYLTIHSYKKHGVTYVL